VEFQLYRHTKSQMPLVTLYPHGRRWGSLIRSINCQLGMHDGCTRGLLSDGRKGAFTDEYDKYEYSVLYRPPTTVKCGHQKTIAVTPARRRVHCKKIPVRPRIFCGEFFSFLVAPLARCEARIKKLIVTFLYVTKKCVGGPIAV